MKFLLILTLFCVPLLAHSETYNVDGRVLNIPHPQNQLNYFGENKEIDSGLIAAAKMSNNRVLAMLCSKQDYSQIIQGKLASPDIMYSIQVDTRYEPLSFSNEDFQDIKKQFKQAYEKQELLRQLMNESEKDILKKAEKLFEFNGQLAAIPSGIVATTDNSFTHSAIVKMVHKGKKRIAYVLVTKFWIDGKIIDLNHTVYSPEDLKAIDSSYLRWIEAIEKAN